MDLPDEDDIPILEPKTQDDTVHQVRLIDYPAPFGFEWLGISYERVSKTHTAARLRGQHIVTGDVYVCESVIEIERSGDLGLIQYMVERCHEEWK